MRALKILMAVMGVLIVAGVAGLGYVVTSRLTVPKLAAPALLDEPEGTRIAKISTSGDRVVLLLQGGGPDRVVVLDLHRAFALMAKMRSKADLPTKTCAACGRDFAWRKKSGSALTPAARDGAMPHAYRCARWLDVPGALAYTARSPDAGKAAAMWRRICKKGAEVIREFICPRAVFFDHPVPAFDAPLINAVLKDAKTSAKHAQDYERFVAAYRRTLANLEFQGWLRTKTRGCGGQCREPLALSAAASGLIGWRETSLRTRIVEPTPPPRDISRARRPRLTSELAAAILGHLRAERLQVGQHLPLQDLADRFDVSRPPVAQALQMLAQQGVVRHEANRGFFVARPAGSKAASVDAMGPLRRIYFQIAEDRLRGVLPDQVSQTALRQTYNLTSGEFQELFGRIAREGWAERRPGYGWSFLPMLTTPQAMEQTYRVRLMLEPAGLLEPGFRLSPEKAERCREREQAMLDGEIETLSADELYERGVQFHETLAEASGNPFLIDTIRRLNAIRRLLAYRTMLDRQRYYRQVRQHLAILDHVLGGRNDEAAEAMRRHLQNVITSLRAVL
eukprot:gene1814-1844_t